MKLTINRAPVLTLWAYVVARRLGHSRRTALTLGRAISGLNAYSKARSLGLVGESETKARKKPRRAIAFMGRRVPMLQTRAGLIASPGGRAIKPDAVARYLRSKFGQRLDSVKTAMVSLARSRRPAELAREAFPLYEHFRPSIPAGSWGRAGVLDTADIRSLARKT